MPHDSDTAADIQTERRVSAAQNKILICNKV